MADSLANASAAPSAHDALYRRIAWRLLPILALGYVLNYIDRTNIGFAQLQMKDQLALSDAAFGLGAGVFFIGYALFEVPSNMLLARWGARVTFLRIMIAWGLISAATAFVSTPAEFYGVRFLLGVAEAGFAPGVLYYFGLWFPDRRRAQAMAIFFAAFAAAPILSGPLAGGIMTWLDGAWGLGGWQWLFIVEGLPTVALGVAVYFWLDNSPAEAKWLTDVEKRIVNEAIEAESRGGAHRHTLWQAVSDPRIWLLGAIFFLVLLGVYAVTFWQPTLLKAMGFTVMQVGLLSAIPAIAGVAAAILVSRHSDRVGERRLHFAASALAAAAGLSLTTFALQNPVLAIVGLSLATAGLAAATPVFWSVPGSFLSRDGAAGGIAAINTIGIMAGALAPPLVGLLRGMTGDFASSLNLLSLMLGLAALLMMLGWRQPAAPAPAAHAPA
jgi:MFS family permease